MTRAQMYADAVSKPNTSQEFPTRRGVASQAYLPGTVGLKDVRLSAKAKLPIRAKTRVGLTAGAVDGSAQEIYVGPCYLHGEAKKTRKVIRPSAKGMLFY